jgi:hypothetical protein
MEAQPINQNFLIKEYNGGWYFYVKTSKTVGSTYSSIIDNLMDCLGLDRETVEFAIILHDGRITYWDFMAFDTKEAAYKFYTDWVEPRMIMKKIVGEIE